MKGKKCSDDKVLKGESRNKFCPSSELPLIDILYRSTKKAGIW
jgi:hypothetical protein